MDVLFGTILPFEVEHKSKILIYNVFEQSPVVKRSKKTFQCICLVWAWCICCNHRRKNKNSVVAMDNQALKYIVKCKEYFFSTIDEDCGNEK